MSATKADTGNGATLTLAISALSLCIQDLEISEIAVDSMEASCLDTAEFAEMAPSDLKKPPKVTATFLTNGTIAEPKVGQNASVTRASGEAYKGETVTFTYPRVGDTGTAGKFAGTGYIESWKPTKFVNGQWQQGTIVIQFDGITGPTYTAQA